MNNHPVCSYSTRTDLLLMTMIWTLMTVAESEMSLKSWSILHRVNDRVRKLQDQSSKDATQDSNQHSLIWRLFVFDITSIRIHGEELLGKFTFHQKDTQFSEPRVHCPEERLKAKEVENYQCTSLLMEIRLKLFRTIISVDQLSTSSVSTEQSQICVRNTKPAK